MRASDESGQSVRLRRTARLRRNAGLFEQRGGVAKAASLVAPVLMASFATVFLVVAGCSPTKGLIRGQSSTSTATASSTPTATATAGAGGAASATLYRQVNLTSNASVPAHDRKSALTDGWGIASPQNAGDPLWVNDEGSGHSKLIDGRGNIDSLLASVMIPAPPGTRGSSHPTGIVVNSTSDFIVPSSVPAPAQFIFDTLDGTIAAWEAHLGSEALTVVDNSASASYTGLAIASIGSSNFLYAANAKRGIDVFDGAFNAVRTSGGFIDLTLQKGLTPYGIANVNGNLFVTYAAKSAPTSVVDEFDPNGNLIRRFATGGSDVPLNAPWAVLTAPANFGIFGNDLLIGNSGDGTIDAFNPSTGQFLGQLLDTSGRTLRITGLRALAVGNDGAGVTNPHAVYFTGASGLFGYIVPARESGTS